MRSPRKTKQAMSQRTATHRDLEQWRRLFEYLYRRKTISQVADTIRDEFGMNQSPMEWETHRRRWGVKKLHADTLPIHRGNNERFQSPDNLAYRPSQTYWPGEAPGQGPIDRDGNFSAVVEEDATRVGIGDSHGCGPDLDENFLARIDVEEFSPATFGPASTSQASGGLSPWLLTSALGGYHPEPLLAVNQEPWAGHILGLLPHTVYSPDQRIPLAESEIASTMTSARSRLPNRNPSPCPTFTSCTRPATGRTPQSQSWDFESYTPDDSCGCDSRLSGVDLAHCNNKHSVS